MKDHFDLVVIGTGTAGSVAAKRVRAAGRSVAIVDERPYGGTCALRGCDPKKVLVGATQALARARALAGKGVAATELHIDWPALMQFKRTFTAPVPEARERSFAEKGIETLHGRAKFTGPNTLTIDGNTVRASRVLIATGATPVPLGIQGESLLATSDDFLELDTLPRRIVFVGGGYIGFELAHIARRADAEVIVLEQGSKVLGPFDSDLVERLIEKSRALGIDIRLRTAVSRIERDGGGFRVFATADGGEIGFSTDLAVHSGGRAPALEALDLEAGQIAFTEGRLELNDYLQSSSNPAVYAAGDSARAGPPLTPVASYDGRIVARNMLEGNSLKPDYAAVPSVVFTVPPLAAVGLGELEARERGLEVRQHFALTADWYSNRRLNEDAAGFKVLIEGDSGRLIGAHVLGPGAPELIDLFALAMHAGLTAKDLTSAFFAYPSFASNLDSML